MVSDQAADEASPRRLTPVTKGRGPQLAAALLATLLATLLVLGAGWLGRQVTPRLFGDAAPLLGHLDPRWSAAAWIPVVIATAAVAYGPPLAARLSFRRLLAGTWLLNLAWAVSLAGADGLGEDLQTLGRQGEYLPGLVHVESLSRYLATFTEHVHSNPDFTWPVHVAGNPAGSLLFFAVLDRIGLGGSAWAGAVVVLAGTSAAAAATWATREVAGEDVARRAAPFLALAPMAVWVATSGDALFLGVSAWGIALLALAAGRRGWRADLLALGGGLLLGEGLHLAYQIGPLGLLAVAVVLARRGLRGSLRPLTSGAVGVLAVVALYSAYGFYWWEGLQATIEAVHLSVQKDRSYAYFVLANPAALAVAVGPATAAGLTGLRRVPRLWWLVGPALFAVAFGTLSGVSKGEVERIWLPFMPWLIAATATLGPDRAPRGWLAAQAALAVLVQSVLVSYW